MGVELPAVVLCEVSGDHGIITVSLCQISACDSAKISIFPHCLRVPLKFPEQTTVAFAWHLLRVTDYPPPPTAQPMKIADRRGVIDLSVEDDLTLRVVNPFLHR